MEKAGYAGCYKVIIFLFMSVCLSLFFQNSKSNVCKWQRRTGDNVDGCAMFWKADK